VNCGSSNVDKEDPLEFDARNGSMEKKKNNWCLGMIGPPMDPEKLLL
jgi:hypothetical protein